MNLIRKTTIVATAILSRGSFALVARMNQTFPAASVDRVLHLRLELPASNFTVCPHGFTKA